jgi:precorrin-4 methylase
MGETVVPVPAIEPSTDREGLLAIVGLPLSGKADDLSVAALRHIERAHRLVYPGQQLAPTVIEALGIQGRLDHGHRLSTSELEGRLSRYLNEGSEVVLLVQGDPAWLSFEPGLRVSALTIARHLESAGHKVVIIPSPNGISTLCASARADLFEDGEVGGVLITTPHIEGPERWAATTCRALATGQAVVALMAERHTDVLCGALRESHLRASCLVGGESALELSVPDEAERLARQPAPFTLILRPQS